MRMNWEIAGSAVIAGVAVLCVASLALASPRGAAAPVAAAPAGGGPLAGLFGDYTPPTDPNAKASGGLVRGANIKLGKNPGGRVAARAASGQSKPDVIVQDYTFDADAATGTPLVSTFAVLQVGANGTTVTMHLWTNLWDGAAVLNGSITPGGGYSVTGSAPGGATVTMKSTLNGRNVDTDFSFVPPKAAGAINTSRSNIKVS